MGVKYVTISGGEALLNGMLDITEEILQLSNRVGSAGTESPRCIINDIHKYRQLKNGSLCAAAKSFFAIDSAGWVRVCNHSPRKVGHLFDEKIISDADCWNAKDPFLKHI